MSSSVLLLCRLLLLFGVLGSSYGATWSDFATGVEQIGPNISCGIGIVIGLVFAFFGYRLFKITLFLCGVVVAGGVAFFLLSNYTDLRPLYLWAAALGAGIIGGALLLFLWTVGIFLLGSLLGFGLAVLAMSVHSGGLFGGAWGQYVLYGAAPLAGGILAVLFEKYIIVLATSLAGSFSVIACVDYFAATSGGGFYQLIPYIVRGEVRAINPVPVTYAEFAACLVLALFSAGVQLFYTGRHHDHREGKGPFCSCGSRHGYTSIQN